MAISFLGCCGAVVGAAASSSRSFFDASWQKVCRVVAARVAVLGSTPWQSPCSPFLLYFRLSICDSTTCEQLLRSLSPSARYWYHIYRHPCHRHYDLSRGINCGLSFKQFVLFGQFVLFALDNSMPRLYRREINTQVISRHQVPGWLRRALRVPDFLKSLGCHFSYEHRRSCSSSRSRSYCGCCCYVRCCCCCCCY